MPLPQSRQTILVLVGESILRPCLRKGEQMSGYSSRTLIFLILIAFAVFVTGCSRQAGQSPMPSSQAGAVPLGGVPPNHNGTGGGDPIPVFSPISISAGQSENTCDASSYTCGGPWLSNYIGCAGCDETGGGGGSWSSIISYTGQPKDGQTCRGSAPVGDLVGTLNVNGTIQDQYIASVNAVVGVGSMTITAPNKIAIDLPVYGWVYKDGGGHYWVEQNTAAQPQFGAGVSAWFTSFSITLPNDSTPHYAGTTAPKHPTGTTAKSCWPAQAAFT
jgi:hypothetical protein